MEFFSKVIEVPEDSNYTPSLELRVTDERGIFQGGNAIVGACSINL